MTGTYKQYIEAEKTFAEIERKFLSEVASLNDRYYAARGWGGSSGFSGNFSGHARIEFDYYEDSTLIDEDGFTDNRVIIISYDGCACEIPRALLEDDKAGRKNILQKIRSDRDEAERIVENEKQAAKELRERRQLDDLLAKYGAPETKD